MDKEKKARLKAKGWVVGEVDDYLGLDKAELAIIDMKPALAEAIVEKRKEQKMTQSKLAKAIGSSQSRVARIEHADPSVSLELMIKSLISLGWSRKEIGKVVGV